jgi:cytochrome c oxidase subunit 4
VSDPQAAMEPGVSIEEHAGIGDPNAHHHSPEQIRREMRVYLAVFIALGILTAVTVGVCYGLHLPVHYAIMVALAVALTKGFLVAAFFMHLLSEKKVIYGVLALTVFFFGLLIWLPWHHHHNTFGS